MTTADEITELMLGMHNDIETLRSFLTEHHNEMPRTALRYAIERMSKDERSYWMRR